MRPEDFGLEKYINFKNADIRLIEKYIPRCTDIKAYEDLIDIMTDRYIVTINYFAGRYICNIYNKVNNGESYLPHKAVEHFYVIGINSFHQFLERVYNCLSNLYRSEVFHIES